MDNRELTLRVLCAAAVGVFLMVEVVPAVADYEAGKAAWQAGRVAEAVAQWRAAADEGDRQAMLELGRLYVQGLGVPQSYVQAHVWLNLAAARGAVDALKERDALAAKMTPQQVAVAQERALSWRPGGGSTPEAGTSERTSAARQGEAGSHAGPPPRYAIMEAQGLLARLGYKPGPADGQWGARSARAYAAFLRDAGMPQTRGLTPEGLRAMRSQASRQATDAAETSAPAQPVEPEPARLPPDALHRAVAAGDIDGLNAVLKARVDVNARDGQGWTALMHAAEKGYKLMVGPLLEAEADVNMQAADGATALFMAVVRGHGEIIEMLVEAGADIWLKGPQGKTALDVAVLQGDSAIVRALVGDVFKDCAECPEMVVIPAGDFMMGSPDDEGGRDGDEGPRHHVTVRRHFAVGRYEVTFEEWYACVEDGGCSRLHDEDEVWERELGRRPMIGVNWEDAQAYVRWLREKTDKEYRLLSEAEWEYVARAGTETRYTWGDEVGRNRANCDGCGSRWDSEKTSPVGSFEANGYGLYDVHGNVWEWVEDCWHENYAGAPTDGSAWTSGGDCGSRVLRGGSWDVKPRYLRSAARDSHLPGYRGNDYAGFRVALTLAR